MKDQRDRWEQAAMHARGAISDLLEIQREIAANPNNSDELMMAMSQLSLHVVMEIALQAEGIQL